MKLSLKFIIGAVFACLLSSRAGAAIQGQTAPIGRDRTYEQNLRWENSADKTITPAKVIRYMLSLRGRTLSAPSSTEFQPKVDANNSQLRVVGEIAYKF